MFALLLAGCALGVIFPLGPGALDVLLIGNFLFSLVLFITAASIREPLGLSSLPTILVIGTLFRLTLNVSTTRLILLGGSPGEVITSVGHLVIGDSLVVGVIVFAVITLVQFLVIGKGAERVAEVSARFSLDALPGRQMAIDADLRAGAIDLKTAAERREELGLESRFYAALDGAMKFIKGDVLAALCIVLINFFGGSCLGLSAGLSFADVVQRYLILSAGDGLLSQTPALLSALAASLVVTRVAKPQGTGLGAEILQQLAGSLVPIGAVVAMLVLISCVPGVPTAPCLIVAAILFLLPLLVMSRRRQEAKALKQSEISSAEFPESSLHLPAVLEVRCPSGERAVIAQLVRQAQSSLVISVGVLLDGKVVEVSDVSGVQFLVRGIPADGCSLSDLSNQEEAVIKVREILISLLPEVIDEAAVRRAVELIAQVEPDAVRPFLTSSASYQLLFEVVRTLTAIGFFHGDLRVLLGIVSAQGAERTSVDELVTRYRMALSRSTAAALADAGSRVIAILQIEEGIETELAQQLSQQPAIGMVKALKLTELLAQMPPRSWRALATSSGMVGCFSRCFAARRWKQLVISYEELHHDYEWKRVGLVTAQGVLAGTDGTVGMQQLL